MRLITGAFARRLDPTSDAPVCVAFSGGPDSYLALQRTLEATLRPVVALHVDHGLNPLSAGWAQRAHELALEAGADFRLLRWEGPKPSTGVPAAARRARHQLLAHAARSFGARVIVTGHTADDALENAELGQGALSEWSPSPVWPHGRGLMLLRPLLAERRAEIREGLAARGVLGGLIDDPANADPRYPRVAARAKSARAASLPIPSDPIAFAFEALPGGGLRLPRQALSIRSLALAMTCAGGGERLPRRAEVERLLGRGAGALVGAKLVPEKEAVLVVRNAGEAARGGLSPLALAAGETGLFDGRFEVAVAERVEIRALRGLAARLPRPQRRRLADLPAALRPALPIVATESQLSCPILSESVTVTVRDLVAARLAQACGAIAHEAGL